MNDARTLRRHRWILIAIFVLSIPVVTPYLRGDGIAYYAYVASAVIDGDLQFENEFRRADSAACWLYFDEDGSWNDDRISPTGHMLNYHSAGPGLLWSPFFAAAHAGVTTYNRWVEPEQRIAADGYSRPYRWVCAFASALFGLLGLLLSHALAARFVSAGSAFWATLGIWFAGNLAVYMYVLPFLSHPASVLVDAAFLTVWWRTARDPRELPTIRTGLAWFALGLLLGIAFSVYYLAALLGIFVIADGLAMLPVWRDSRDWRAHARNAATIAVPGLIGLGLGFLPHAIPKWILYGDPFALGYGLEWQPERPFLFEVLFSAHRGLLTWHPVYALSLVGICALVPRARRFSLASLAVFGACTWLIASKPNWHGGSAFGNRYFLLLTPVFVVGLAAFLETGSAALGRRLGTRASWAKPICIGVLGALALWNAGFVLQWGTNLIPNRGPVSFREVARNQVTAVPAKFIGFVLPFITDREGLVRKIEREDFEEIDSRIDRAGICDPVN